MTLELLVNWMVKDFYIWWKYWKKKETLLPIVHYFLQVYICTILAYYYFLTIIIKPDNFDLNLFTVYLRGNQYKGSYMWHGLHRPSVCSKNLSRAD